MLFLFRGHNGPAARAIVGALVLVAALGPNGAGKTTTLEMLDGSP
jgi:ABC-type hemin transport system ATPase subunit